MDKNGALHVDYLLNANSHGSMLVEQAVLGDAITCNSFTNGYTEPNIVKQALSLLNRKVWKTTVDT